MMAELDDLRIDERVPKPRRKRRLPWLPVVVVLFAFALIVYFQRGRLLEYISAPAGPAPAATATAEQAEPIPPVPSGPAGSISAAGYLEVIPPGPTVVSALVGGRVVKVGVVPGEQVSAGTVVAVLDTGILLQQAAVLESREEVARRRLELLEAGSRSQEIDQAEAALRSAEARLEQASADWQRSQRLFESGVVARQELDARRTAMLQAQSVVDESRARVDLLRAGTRTEDLRIAEADLSAARAELARVHWEIGQCTLRAPQAGVVLEQFVTPGDWVMPGTDNPRSAAVLSIFDPSRIQAWVDVNQRDSGGLFIGQRVELTTDAQPERVVAGTVSRIMPQANLQKNTVQVKISITDPPEDLRPELSVKVVFLPREDEQVVAASTDQRGEWATP